MGKPQIEQKDFVISKIQSESNVKDNEQFSESELRNFESYQNDELSYKEQLLSESNNTENNQ